MSKILLPFESLPDFKWWENDRFMVDHRSSLPIIGGTQILGPIPLTTIQLPSPNANPLQAIIMFNLYVKLKIDWWNGLWFRVRKPKHWLKVAISHVAMQLSSPNAIPYKLSWCSTCMSSLKLIGQTVFKLESRNHTRRDGQMDRWMDVGHINLIGGLVTCNPPNKTTLFYFKVAIRFAT